MNFRLLAKYWRTVWIVAEMTLRQQLVDGFVLFTILFQPIIIALLGLWMLKDKGAEGAMFVVVGSGLTGLWSSLLFISGNSINIERWIGTLESIVAVPTPFEVVIFGKNLANVLQSLISMVLGYLAASLVFGYSLHIQQPVLFFISILLSVFAFVTFGLALAPIFIINPAVQAWQNGMEFPVYVLCGFMFPIALLPGWTTPISYILSPYWAAVALHGTSSGGATLHQTLFAWAMLVLFSILDLVLASRLLKLMLYKARADATLGME
ncbi:MAG TPA: ABC transporter permease [Anaerolineales bacterium]